MHQNRLSPRTIAKWLVGTVVVLAAAVFVAWASSPDPRFNPASFEHDRLLQRLAPLEQATTLAQFRSNDGQTRTMLVLAQEGESVTGIDLAELGAGEAEDPFEALAAANLAPVLAGDAGSSPQITLPMGDLLPSGPSGTQHIGTGTNFPEHAEEANSGAVFQFPKFGTASPARTRVQARPGILLD